MPYSPNKTCFLNLNWHGKIFQKFLVTSTDKEKYCAKNLSPTKRILLSTYCIIFRTPITQEKCRVEISGLIKIDKTDFFVVL